MPNIKKVMQPIIALLILLGFAWLFGDALFKTFNAVTEPPKFTDGHIIVASGCAGIIGAAVAVALGQEPPGTTGRSRIETVGILAFPTSPEELLEVIGWIYVIVYFGLGVLGIVAWITKGQIVIATNPDLVPELVKELSSVVLGIIFGVGGAIYVKP